MRGGTVMVLVTAVLLASGAARLAYIEYHEGERLRERSLRQQTTVREIPALRGEILDTRGRVLAGTIQRPSIFVDPSLVEDVPYAAHSVAPQIGMSVSELTRILTERADERFVVLKRRMEVPELDAYEREFSNFLRARRLRGFGIQLDAVRVYTQGRLAPHVIGFVGADLQGLAGIELMCEELLGGRPGKRTSVVDVARRRVRADEEVPAIDGSSVVLTIDAYAQQIAQDKLRAAVERHEADWGTVIVMDPHTGEVLAMAVVPDFDPADPIPSNFSTLSPKRQEEYQALWKNRAVTDAYEPGSIFKPFIASFALDEGVTRIDEIYPINGPVHDFGRRTIRDTHPYGQLALHEVISKSSNIGMGLLGARLRMDRLYRYVRTWGFGDYTGIELPGEHTGIVQEFSKWNPSFSPQSIPIGQEISVTPIQMVTAFSALANGGVLYRPRIIRGVIGPNGETIRDDTRPIAVRRVLNAQTVELFRREALVETVVAGTGKAAALDDWQVFGKTGTAQMAGVHGGRGYGGGYVASFIGGAPATQPRLVAMCSLIRPKKGGYYGGAVSAPVVKEVLGEILAYMQVPAELLPDEKPESARVGRAGSSARRQTTDGGD